MTDIAAADTERNREAWNAGRYDLWVAGVGTPAEEAARIRANPAHWARRVAPYVGDVAGLRICQLQGSHGRIAVALALMGAKPTVIDFAEENARYAADLAAAAGVTIDYYVRDVMQAPALGLEPFDVLVLELGVFHYHQDLTAFFDVVASLTRAGGRLVIAEFHPVRQKLFQTAAPRDYFRTTLIEGPAPSPVPGGPPLGACVYRHWTLAEIVQTTIDKGFRIETFQEHPDWDDPTFPGTFTLVGVKTPS
jgi:2-polyprenyl-3-methyl-5-hydroxy-6-metoxy-1,4-benzoquinol methylase